MCRVEQVRGACAIRAPETVYRGKDFIHDPGPKVFQLSRVMGKPAPDKGQFLQEVVYVPVQGFLFPAVALDSGPDSARTPGAAHVQVKSWVQRNTAPFAHWEGWLELPFKDKDICTGFGFHVLSVCYQVGSLFSFLGCKFKGLNRFGYEIQVQGRILLQFELNSTCIAGVQAYFLLIL